MMTQFCFGLCFVYAVSTAAAGDIRYDLTPIDRGQTWVSGYWGYNAPKLAYDGRAFYTVGLWGPSLKDCHGNVYKFENGKWIRGAALEGTLQPPMILLDSEKRLNVIYARENKPPRHLRSRRAGEILDFEDIPMHPHAHAGKYMGAGIYKDRIVLCYIAQETYSFYFNVLDLKTGKWSEPALLKTGQQAVYPHTGWVYPVVVPDEKGVHLLITNADTSLSYNRVGYLHVPYDVHGEQEMQEVLCEIPPNPVQVEHGKIAFGQAIWLSPDGTINAVVLYQPAHTVGLYAFRRDPKTGQWADTFIRKASVGLKPGDEKIVITGKVLAGNATLGAVGSLFGDKAGRLWLMSTAGDHLDLFHSDDEGLTWNKADLGGMESFGLKYAYFLHGLRPSSGSIMPDGPCSVFCSSIEGGYQTWFMQVHLPQAPGK